MSAHSKPIERIDASALSPDEFTQRYMTGRGQPVIIRGIPEREGSELVIKRVELLFISLFFIFYFILIYFIFLFIIIIIIIIF
jgi:hypothetical protein